MAPTRHMSRRDLLKAAPWAMAPAAFALSGCDPTKITTGGGARPAPVKVALFVPLDAADSQVAGIGASMVKAAQMAVAEMPSPLVSFKVYATRGDAAVAQAAAQTALAEGADVILGPLFAQSAAAVGRVAAPAGKAVLAFSNNTEVAGGNVFVMGDSFENSASQLGRYAAAHGKSRIFVIYADTPSERFAQGAIGRGLAGTGAQVVGSAAFEYSMEGMVASLPAISQQAAASGANALFLTTNLEGGLRELTNLMPDYGLGIDKYQYIGLGRWDSLPSAAALPGLQDGWFAIPDPASEAEFNRRYIAANETAPTPLSRLAYDGINAIAQQAAKGGPAAVSPQALVAAGVFPGIGGQFAFQANGTVSRDMTIATIRNSALTTLQQATSRIAVPAT